MNRREFFSVIGAGAAVAAVPALAAAPTRAVGMLPELGMGYMTATEVMLRNEAMFTQNRDVYERMWQEIADRIYAPVMLQHSALSPIDDVVNRLRR